MLLDEVTARFSHRSAAPAVEFTQVYRALVLREAGERLARITVPYAPSQDAITAFSARVISPDGSVHRFGRKDAADLPSHPGFVMYSDSRALSLTLHPVVTGSVVEYRYTVRHADSRLAFVSQEFGDRMPARRVRLEIRAPLGWEIDHVASRLGARIELPPTVDQVGAERRWVWERHDVPALPDEPMAPSASLLTTNVSVRARSWPDGTSTQHAAADVRAYSAWLYTRTTPAPAGAEVRRLGHQLVDALPADVTQRAARLYAWVRDSISYCAIEIAEGGWRPHPASSTLQARYGDCKDKATLLGALLDAIGVPSRPTLVYHHDGWPVPFLLEQGANFNHAILAVDLPGGTVYADPTSRAVPFGELPTGDQEADLLPVSARGETLVHAPASAPETNSETLRIELTAGDHDALQGRFSLSLNGDRAEALRTKLLRATGDEHKHTVRDALGLTSARVDAVAITGEAPPDRATPIEVTGQVRLEDALPDGAIAVLSLARLAPSQVPALPARARRTPLVLRARKHATLRLTLALRSGEEASLPPPVALDRPAGRYTLRWVIEGRSLIVERTLTLRERIFMPADYAQLRALFDEILAAETRGVTLRRGRS